jgi:hypothetical protein
MVVVPQNQFSMQFACDISTCHMLNFKENFESEFCTFDIYTCHDQSVFAYAVSSRVSDFEIKLAQIVKFTVNFVLTRAIWRSKILIVNRPTTTNFDEVITSFFTDRFDKNILHR